MLLDRASIPDEALQILRNTPVSQLATLNKLGVPIVDPLLHVAGEDGTTVDYGTGLAYPLKAERARRNPRVGLFFNENGRHGAPAASVAAMSAVRDADLQHNTDRWVEAYRRGWMPPGVLDRPWREAVWYLTRIFVCCTPLRIFWWPDGDLNRAPERWDAAAGTVPESDPAATGRPSPLGERRELDWQHEARRVLDRDLPAPLLTGVDGDGFPLPKLSAAVAMTDDGFELQMPCGVRATPAGTACLSFEAPGGNPPGIGGNFVGTVVPDGTRLVLTVDRVLPGNPRAVSYGDDPAGHLFPPDAVRSEMISRLEHELARRDAAMPVVRGLDAVDEPSHAERGLVRRNNQTERRLLSGVQLTGEDL